MLRDCPQRIHCFLPLGCQLQQFGSIPDQFLTLMGATSSQKHGKIWSWLKNSEDTLQHVKNDTVHNKLFGADGVDFVNFGQIQDGCIPLTKMTKLFL